MDPAHKLEEVPKTQSEPWATSSFFVTQADVGPWDVVGAGDSEVDAVVDSKVEAVVDSNVVVVAVVAEALVDFEAVVFDADADELDATQSAVGLHVNLLTAKSKGPTQQTYPVSQTLCPLTQSFQALTGGPVGVLDGFGVVAGLEATVVVVNNVDLEEVVDKVDFDTLGTAAQSEDGRQVDFLAVKSSGPTQQTYPDSQALCPMTQSFHAPTTGPIGDIEVTALVVVLVAESVVVVDVLVVVATLLVVVGRIEQSFDGRQVNLPKVKSRGPTQHTNPSGQTLVPTVQSL